MEQCLPHLPANNMEFNLEEQWKQTKEDML